MEEVYKQCEELSDIISPLKEVNRRYQQVITIMMIIIIIIIIIMFYYFLVEDYQHSY